MALTNKAMLVTLSISYWTGRASDDRVVDEISKAHKAEKDAHDYHKILVHPDAINKVKAVRSRARAYHFEKTLPWIDGGTRILPAAFYEEYSTKMREFRGEYEQAATDFIRQYNGLKGEARKRLGSLYREEDYPAQRSLEAKFAYKVGVLPIPEAGDWRVKLGAKEEAHVRKQIEEQLRQAMAVATRDLWKRLFDVVSDLATKMKEKGDIVFRDSLIGNIRQVLEVLPAMNVADDPKLEDMRKKVEHDLAKLNPAELREADAKTRKKVADAADELLAKMAGYVGGE